VDNYSEHELVETLSELRLEYKAGSGRELTLHRCPFCEPDRTKRSDHFSFNTAEGVYHCVKCSASGNLITFRRNLGLDPFPTKIYRKLDQAKVQVFARQPETYYQAYFRARGIPEPILKKYGVGKAEYSGLGTCRTYQYVDTDGTIVNVKYVNAKKEMRQEKDSRKIYYGLQFVDYAKEVLHVTEGEDDCHALVAMGFDNVVSIPSGAKMYSEEMGQANAKFKKIILFFDNDRAGQEGAEKFAQKAGVWKCWNVVLPFKDVRDCLLHGIDIFSMNVLINQARKFQYSPDTKNRPALWIGERMDRYEADAASNTEGIRFGYAVLDNYTGGLRGGDVLAIVANPGCFKTTTLMNLIKRAVDRTESGIAIFFSLEMQIEAAVERELQLYMADDKPYITRKAAAEKSETWKKLRAFLESSRYARVYVSEEFNSSVSDMLEIIDKTESASGEKCIMVGIDYLDFVNGKSSKEYDLVKEVMLSIKKQIARKLNIPVIILAQTGRDNKDSDEEVTMRSGKGGTAIEATSDFFIGMWRHEDRVVGRLAKHRRIVAATREYPYLSFHIKKGCYEIEDICEAEKPAKKACSVDF
jgi:hypothetical protein